MHVSACGFAVYHVIKTANRKPTSAITVHRKMLQILHDVDQMLRGRRPRRGALWLIVMSIICAMTYGVVMGSYDARPMQMFYSAVKMPLLLGVTGVITLPSFFVLNTLLGVRDDFADAMTALLSTQAAVTIILLSLSPLTMFWYASGSEYNPAILFNGGMFAIATFSSQVLLRRLYRPLVARNDRHRVLLRCWLGTFTFVGIQMGWVLRPFIGNPLSPVQFFREGAWSNAYVFVGRLIWDTVFK